MPRIHYKKYKGITLLARELRKNQTPSEKFLWKLLRRKNLFGYRFLRQHPLFYRVDKEWVEFFIADFYCSKLKLVIEVDGKIHEDRTEYDAERDLKLLNKGIRVVRIKNEELKDVKSALEVINKTIYTHISQFSDNKSKNPSLKQ
jgi:very-short-patch-repair endonuclease